MDCKKSLFHSFPDITPQPLKSGMSITSLIEYMGRTCFEARNVANGARLFRRMIDEDDTIWLGISGAGIAGGMGGAVISLLQNGFIDVICSTGAQVYHDLHFAFRLPVKAISPFWDDDLLRKHGDTRIYDIGIRDKETLCAQDNLIQRFVKDRYEALSKAPLASHEFMSILGEWVNSTAPRPDLSFVATAATLGVPIFWDSLANHSIAMNLVQTELDGFPVIFSPQRDIMDSAAIAYNSESTGFVELGGGGPKNFIQQTAPTIDQILGVPFDGASKGIQIGTAIEKEGSLSGCTFSEGVTWGKYESADTCNLVQIWGEYSIIFPMLVAFVMESCEKRLNKQISGKIASFVDNLKGSINGK